MSIELVATIEDSDGDTATTSIRINDDATVAGMQEFAEAYFGAAAVLIYGGIRNVIAILRPSISGLTNNIALAGSSIFRQAKFEFVTASGNRVKMNVPCLLEAVGQGVGPDELDVSDPDVSAFISMMENGITISGSLVQPCDIGEESIVDTVFAREAFKNSGSRA